MYFEKLYSSLLIPQIAMSPTWKSRCMKRARNVERRASTCLQ